MIKVVLVLSCLCFFSSANAELNDNAKRYYGMFSKSGDIKTNLFTVLSSYHLPKKDKDLLLPNCSEGGCFVHSPVSYKSAREYLFGFLHLTGNSPQTYKLDNYYCYSTLTNSDFGKKSDLAPMHIPDNKIVNAEHSWPQSMFTNKFPKGTQKADLHILFPTLSTVNSIRGNFPFGEVEKPKNEPCATAALGISKEGEQVFEPDDIIKGDLARAVFYYVTRYKVELGKNQEAYLRKWHEADPVDEKEIERNQKIFEIQKVRNPYIDMPELVSEIPNL